MEAKAYLRYIRISPRKVQIVCDLIRGKDVNTAMAILMQTPKAASEPLVKLLKSAVANAENNFGLSADELMLKSVMVDEGPTFRRTMARARGSANMIRKRTAHITVILAPTEA